MFKPSLILITLTVLAGCGTRIDSMTRTIDYAIFGEDDVTLSEQEIAGLAYPYQYLTVSEQPRIALALGFDDDGIYKWLSGNKEVLTTINGRIINLQGLEESLVHVEQIDQDPLRCLLHGKLDCQLTWQPIAIFGRSYNTNEITVQARFSRQQDETLTLPAGNTVATEYWQEKMSHNGRQWTNHFWISKANRRVVKSEQRWGAERRIFRLTEVKAYAKELQGGQEQSR